MGKDYDEGVRRGWMVMMAAGLLGFQVLLALALATALEGYTVRLGVPLSALVLFAGAMALLWLGLYAGRAVWRNPPRLM